MGFADPIVGGIDKLIRKAIQSPNFIAGVQGWSINRDGTAEFNELTIIASSTSAAILIYNGPAALGNLIGSWSAVETTDSFGNNIPAGLFATQGTFTGMQLVNTLLTQCILDAAVMDAAQISNSDITGGTVTETVINFDNSGGALLCYAVTQTTISQTVAGNYQFTVPANVQTADVICKGAFPGGNGGGNGSGGHGGSGPECAREQFYTLPPAGTVIDYTVGKAGDNSNTGGGDGNDGGDTFFDISNAGVIGHGGNADGTPGTGSTNTVHFDGGTGGTASGTGGGGCGGGAGTTGAGGNGTNNSGSGSAAGGTAGSGGGTAGGAGGANAANGSTPGGGAGAGSGTVSFNKTYTCTATHTYQGSDGTNANQKINDNGTSYQGGDRANTYNGRAKTWIEFNNSQIQSDLAGVNISSTQVRLNNNHTWYNSGMTAAIGWDTATSFGSTKGDPSGSNIDSTRVHYDEGESKFVAVSGLGTAFKNGTAFNVVLFHDSNSLTYYGYFAGKNQSSPPQVKIQGSSGGASQNSGAGKDGSISIAYTSGAALLFSIAAVSGTDQYGNAYTSGFTTPNGQVDASQTNQNDHTVTQTSSTILGSTFTVPANDALQDVEYIYEAWGNGTWGTAVQLNWLAQLDGAVISGSQGIANNTITSGNAFNWRYTQRAIYNSNGNQIDVHEEFAISENSAGAQGGAVVLRMVSGVTFTQSASHTFGLNANWAATTGSPSITCKGSSLTRRGVRS